MLNKDKRNLVFCMLLGDGCIGVYKTDRYKTGRLVIDHGISQADYQAWKAQLLEIAFVQPVRLYTGHKGKSVQIQMRNKKFKTWHKFTHVNNRKSIPNILRWINNPWLAIAIWLMDDGYCESSISKLADGSKKNYGARFRLFTATQTPEEMEKIKVWLDEKLGINCSIKYHKDTRQKKEYPLIKINGADTLKIWTKIREVVLRFKSMRYKFRHVEEIYQSKFLQRTTT